MRSWLSERRRRAAGRANKQNGAFDFDDGMDGTSHVIEAACPDDHRTVRIRTERAGRTRRTMKWRLDVAEKIVMLELRRHHEDQMQRHPEDSEATAASISQPAEHLFG